MTAYSPTSQNWHCARGHVVSLGDRVLIMGILNVTPDSFSDGGRFCDVSEAVDHAQAMVDQGADIIDIGAESTRPGALDIEEAEEIRRLKPVLQALGGRLHALISVDTRKAAVARMALDLGAGIINDVSALHFDSRMASVIAEYRAGLILMHMRGTPLNMQAQCQYGDVIQDVKVFLKNRMEYAEQMGIAREHIVLDPGIGFAKTVEQNVVLVAQCRLLQELSRPMIIGVSNKSFIGALTGKSVHQRSLGTAAAVTAAVLQGVAIVRVHDVGDMYDVVRIAEALRDESVV